MLMFWVLLVMCMLLLVLSSIEIFVVRCCVIYV